MPLLLPLVSLGFDRFLLFLHNAFFSLPFTMLLLQESSGPFVRPIVVTSSSAVPEICRAQLIDNTTDFQGVQLPFTQRCSLPDSTIPPGMYCFLTKSRCFFPCFSFFLLWIIFIFGFWGYRSNTIFFFVLFWGWFWMLIFAIHNLSKCVHHFFYLSIVGVSSFFFVFLVFLCFSFKYL